MTNITTLRQTQNQSNGREMYTNATKEHLQFAGNLAIFGSAVGVASAGVNGYKMNKANKALELINLNTKNEIQKANSSNEMLDGFVKEFRNHEKLTTEKILHKTRMNKNLITSGILFAAGLLINIFKDDIAASNTERMFGK